MSRSVPTTVMRALGVAVLALSLGAQAAGGKAQRFDIPGQELAAALKQFAVQSDLEILFAPEDAAAKQTAGVRGEYVPAEALRILLSGTGLQFRITSGDSIVVESQDSRATTAVSQADAALRLARSPAAAEAQGRQEQTTGAANSAEDEGNKLQEIIVTAQKRAERLKDVPMSIVAVDAEELARRGISTTVDIAQSIPGVAVQDRGAAVSRYIFMRGLGNTRGSQAMVGVYLDEQDVTGFPFYALDLRAYDLERLEVLRGPQGTLYGSGAMGGVIRYITKRPDLSAVSGDTYVIASATQDGAPSATVGGSLNLPLAGNKLGLRIAGFYEESGGWIDQPAVSKSDINDQQLYSARVKGLWRPADALEISALAMIYRNDAGAPNIGEDRQGNYTQRFGRATTPSGSNDYETYNLTARYSFGAFDIVSSTGYFDLHLTSGEIGSIAPLSPPPAVPFDSLNATDDLSATSFVQEVRLASTGISRFHWTLGGSYRDAEQERLAVSLFGLPNAPAAFPSLAHETSEAWAVFGEGGFDLTTRFTLGAGLRYYEDTQKNVVTVQSGHFNQLSPRFFAKYAATDQVSFYANVAKGFRSGGFNTALAISRGAPPSFESDVIWSYELGSKGELLDGRMAFDIAGFYSEYQDIQDTGIALLGGLPIALVGNLGEAVINGVDWDIALKLTNAFSIGTSGEYLTENRFTRLDALDASQAVGDPLKQIPKDREGVWAMYELQRWLGGDGGYIRIDYNRQGIAEYRNRRANGSTPFYFSRSDRIDMLNLSVGWEKDRASVQLFGRNLLNDRGYIDGESLELLAARSRPRTFGVQLNYHFD